MNYMSLLNQLNASPELKARLRVILRDNILFNNVDYGNSLDIDTVSNGFNTTSSILGAALKGFSDNALYNLSQVIQDRDNAQTVNTNFKGTSTGDILNDYNNLNLMHYVNGKDYYLKPSLYALNTISNTAQGAMNGASSGGIGGAIAGGLFGLFGSLAGIGVGKKNANIEAQKTNIITDSQNANALANFSNASNNLDMNRSLLLLRNYAADGGYLFKDGGIYIKPSKRGTFTAAAKQRGLGVQEFASRVLANKDNYSTAMIRKANFAHVFGGRHYLDGGNINYEVGKIYDLSLQEIQRLKSMGYGIEEV